MTVFNRTIEKATLWVKDMMAELPSQDPHQALHALRAGMHAVRDRLTVDEAVQLAAQFPMVLRGLFFENWRPAGKPLRLRNTDEFLALVQDNYLPRTDASGDAILRALFRVLDKHITAGEIEDVQATLPQAVVQLVRRPAAAAPAR
jgi:uncharacterized protein (DUF2267 family)